MNPRGTDRWLLGILSPLRKSGRNLSLGTSETFAHAGERPDAVAHKAVLLMPVAHLQTCVPTVSTGSSIFCHLRHSDVPSAHSSASAACWYGHFSVRRRSR